MPYTITLVGAQANESTPNIAVYTFDARGRIDAKVAVAAAGQLDIDPRRLPRIVAFGPDADELSSLDPASLLTVRLSDQVPIWEKNNAILIPAQWWRRWLGFLTCVSGQAFRCFPFILGLTELRSIALGQEPIRLPEVCEPMCNAIVEVWESTCCRWPILLPEVPRIIANLKQFLAANPIMFPVPPRSEPGPIDRALLRSVNSALGAGKVSLQFAPSTDLSLHLQTLESLSASDVVTYIEANPSLWWLWCDCTSVQLGETPLNPDGTFTYCFWRFPFLLFNCRTTFFYKVKQFVGGQWVYVYDGAAAHQYFTADQVADLYTLTGQTCFQPQPPPGSDFVTLQAIGLTYAWELNSHWNGANAADVDLTQTGDNTLAGPPTDAGLVLANGAPWGQTLSFLLYFDPGMEALGAYYYRLSVVQADASGQPLGSAAPVPITNPVAWSKFVTVGGQTTIESQTLGSNTVIVGGNPVIGLYQIPYNADADWLGDQFHQYLDTTQLTNGLGIGLGAGNGRFLLVLEIFDQSGNRLIPQTAAPTGPTDQATPFNFLRLLSSSGAGSTATVPFAALTHMIWVDNRPVIGDIDDFLVVSGGQTTIGSQECQFLSAPGAALFEVGYRAYHNVMCDASPSPIPSHTFMQNFELDWEEGLNGPSGVLAAGDDTNQPNPAWPTCPSAVADAVSPGISFATLLGDQTACAFAITLHVYAKHTNGIGRLSIYDREIPSAVALSIGP
jgi:hypothetical protein